MWVAGPKRPKMYRRVARHQMRALEDDDGWTRRSREPLERKLLHQPCSRVQRDDAESINVYRQAVAIGRTTVAIGRTTTTRGSYDRV